MVEEEVFNKNPCYFYCVSGSVIRRWILEASTTPHGPWTTLRNHDEDNTFLNDVSSGNDKSLSFLYAPSSLEQILEDMPGQSISQMTNGFLISVYEIFKLMHPPTDPMLSISVVLNCMEVFEPSNLMFIIQFLWMKNRCFFHSCFFKAKQNTNNYCCCNSIFR